MWEEDDAEQLYLVLKVSCRRTDNLQPGTTIIQTIYSIRHLCHLCRLHFHSFRSLGANQVSCEPTKLRETVISCAWLPNRLTSTGKH